MPPHRRTSIAVFIALAAVTAALLTAPAAWSATFISAPPPAASASAARDGAFPAPAAAPPALSATARIAVARVLPPFKGSVHCIDASLKAKMLASGSWKPSCPVRLSQLRLIKVTFLGFDGRAHRGNLVVARGWARPLLGVFRTLYDARFRFRRIRLIDAYQADDRRSMRADNTSAFNGRYVSGTTRWSMHAYGLAIDINPVENPWVDGRYVSPPNGAPYADRSKRARGMIHADDVVVRAFRSIGWKWGGDWPGAKDYQHFSSTGG